MRLVEIVEASQRIAATSKRTAKLGYITDLLKRAAPEEVPVAVAFLSGELRQRKTNVGYATIRAATPQSIPDISTLTLLDVDNSFEQITNVQAGTRSNRERERLLRELFARASPISASSCKGRQNARPRGPRSGVGAWPPARQAQQSASRRA